MIEATQRQTGDFCRTGHCPGAAVGELQSAYDAAHTLAQTRKRADRILFSFGIHAPPWAELIYAQSDQAVERWAREDAMMIQPGDIPIVLLPPTEQVPTPSVIEPVVIDKIQKWEIWQALFLGD